MDDVIEWTCEVTRARSSALRRGQDRSPTGRATAVPRAARKNRIRGNSTFRLAGPLGDVIGIRKGMWSGALDTSPLAPITSPSLYGSEKECGVERR